MPERIPIRKVGHISLAEVFFLLIPQSGSYDPNGLLTIPRTQIFFTVNSLTIAIELLFLWLFINSKIFQNDFKKWIQHQEPVLRIAACLAGTVFQYRLQWPVFKKRKY